nr:pyridoxal-dependent decarboxylase [Cryobacterium algoricola]
MQADPELNPGFFEINRLLARPGEATVAPRYVLGADPMEPETTYQIIHDEIMLDGNARLNLATFVGTWMDDHAGRLYAEAFDKNTVDKDEYPQTAAIEEYCWRMIAGLWHAPEPMETVGTSRTDRAAQRRDEFRSAGVLGEILQLLGRRASIRAHQ